MKGIKRHIALSISAFLLLCFSVTILPLDLLHDHQSEVSSACQDSKTGQLCNHKYHLSQKSNPCWLCAIHYDKTFISHTEKFTLYDFASFPEFSNKKVTTYFIKLIFSSLRGPPAA